jgi:transposase
LAQDKKSARRQRAYLVLIDESGFLMSPLVRRTLAPRGHTPILKTTGARREKVSITAAMTISPKRRHLGLYWRTFPRDYVNAQRSADFLCYLLRHLRGKVIVVWDGGPMHKGDPIRKVLHDYPRLHLERLPPYAPDLNPVEYLWAHTKYDKLPNYVPASVSELDKTIHKEMAAARESPEQLSGHFNAARLPFR